MMATFAAGCFWGIEAVFSKIPGVIKTAVGYTGGYIANPTYEQVCRDETGHAEAVLIEYDETKVSYEQLLDVFWNCHNPTTLNRQGPDHGTQYRSAIFYHNERQKALALKSKLELDNAGRFNTSIVTDIVPAQTFNRAEEYHQKYFEKHAGGCHV